MIVGLGDSGDLVDFNTSIDPFSALLGIAGTIAIVSFFNSFKAKKQKRIQASDRELSNLFDLEFDKPKRRRRK